MPPLDPATPSAKATYKRDNLGAGKTQKHQPVCIQGWTESTCRCSSEPNLYRVYMLQLFAWRLVPAAKLSCECSLNVSRRVVFAPPEIAPHIGNNDSPSCNPITTILAVSKEAISFFFLLVPVHTAVGSRVTSPSGSCVNLKVNGPSKSVCILQWDL